MSRLRAFAGANEGFAQACASQILLFSGVPVGVLSYERRDDGSVYLGCLCIVPEMQGRGLGTRAFAHMPEECPEVHRFELVTPADKAQNTAFYTRKCGCRITGYE